MGSNKIQEYSLNRNRIIKYLRNVRMDKLNKNDVDLFRVDDDQKSLLDGISEDVEVKTASPKSKKQKEKIVQPKKVAEVFLG